MPRDGRGFCPCAPMPSRRPVPPPCRDGPGVIDTAGDAGPTRSPRCTQAWIPGVPRRGVADQSRLGPRGITIAGGLSPSEAALPQPTWPRPAGLACVQDTPGSPALAESAARRSTGVARSRRPFARWCNGSTSVFGTESPGSSPGRVVLLGRPAGRSLRRAGRRIGCRALAGGVPACEGRVVQGGVPAGRAGGSRGFRAGLGLVVLGCLIERLPIRA